MNVMGIVFTNNTDIGGLTDRRTMASLPYGGRYRLVDFTLSNLVHAGIRHVVVIARYSYQSLINHIGDGEEWGLELTEGGLEFMTPFATSPSHNYRGKVESLYAAMDYLKYSIDTDEYVVMMDSSVICNIDMKKVISAHAASGKDITVVTTKALCDGKRTVDLAMKLGEDGEVQDMVVDYAAPADYVGGMDIYVTTKKFLVKQVENLVAHNWFHLDRDLILGGWMHDQVSVNAFVYEGLAMFNDSVEEYFANNLALVRQEVREDIFGRVHPVYTRVRDRVPSYYGEGCDIQNTVVADGCMLEGTVKNSVLFRQITVAEGAVVEDSIIMNDTVIGEGAELRNVILDKNVTVSPGAKLIGTKKNPVIIKRGESV